MNELLPVALGACLAALFHSRAKKTSPLRIALACIGAGLLAAFVNEELAGAGWQFFVSVDAASCAIGYLAMAGLVIGARRLRPAIAHGFAGSDAEKSSSR